MGSDRTSGYRKLRFAPSQKEDGRLDEIAFVRGRADTSWAGDASELPGDLPVTDVYAYNGSREHGAGHSDKHAKAQEEKIGSEANRSPAFRPAILILAAREQFIQLLDSSK